ncbi:MAG TPA: metallophosphoesterase family protein [Ktedonobacteraceae bacterium]|jgi:diadenosine tetraphosphatase ApaH/serine/threonine PP2A family protein phosphatase
MRYAIFTDVHANLEALEAVLAKIDEIAQEEPIDQIWFLGDLVGYGPNPNECIETLRSRTDTIIAGNHDWAAVGKINLDDFSEAARISAEWTASQLTEEHREFLIQLPEHIELEQENCILVHGSPYGPLWEYLTSEVLAERSFECFSTRYCFVGHTHIPVIFQQPYDAKQISVDNQDNYDDEDTIELVSVRSTQQNDQEHEQQQQAHVEPEPPQALVTDAVDTPDVEQQSQTNEPSEQAAMETAEEETASAEESSTVSDSSSDQSAASDEQQDTTDEEEQPDITNITSEEDIKSAEERLNEEIEELLSLLGISENMVHTTNEMLIPPEGHWQAPDNYRAIVNPGGVGQPRDGNPRAALMIYDTEHGFTFYRVEYNIEKTQEKIIKAGLPPYLAARLAYGR